MSPFPVVLAHGVGARGELPLPLWWVLYGAIAVIVLTFLMLSRHWSAPRFEDRPVGRPIGAGAERLLGVARVGGRVAGTVVFAVVVAAAVRGGEFPAYALFVGLWVLVPLVAAVLGDVYSLGNPFAALAAALDRAGVGAAPAWLERAGVWPAALLLLGFGWVELAHPDPSDADVVLGFLLAYAAILVLGGLWWGRRWVEQADGFGVLFSLVGRIGVLGRGADGRLRLRPPFVGLVGTPPVRGTAGVLLVALGVTSFDGLSRSLAWEGLLGTRLGWSATPLQTVGMLVLVAIVALAYATAMSSAATLVERPSSELVEAFAPTLVPVVLGYAVAHYFSIGVLGRGADGRLRLRPPFVGLVGTPPVRGTAGVLLVALGVTSFDGLSRSLAWEGLLGTRLGWSATPLQTVGMLVLVAIVALAYATAMSSAATLVERPSSELVEAFAPTLVPVVLGYAVAHYFSLVVLDGGQLLLAMASDPLGLGWDLFGTADNRIDFTLVSSATIAYVQIAAILLGHVAGVVLAHDRAVARFDPEIAGPSQHALLGAMVLYTVGGLVLLLGA